MDNQNNAKAAFSLNIHRIDFWKKLRHKIKDIW